MMFNTGDIVSWRKDGSLDSYGRLDDQVKIKVCHLTSNLIYMLIDAGLPG